MSAMEHVRLAPQRMTSPWTTVRRRTRCRCGRAEAFVVDADKVEDGGMEVVDGRESRHRFLSEFVGGAVAEPAFHAGAGHPAGKAMRVVVSATGALLENGMRPNSVTKTTSVSSSSPRAQVTDQAGDRLVEDGRVDLVL